MKKNILALLMVGQFGMTLADEAAEYNAKRQEVKKIIKCSSLLLLAQPLNSIEMANRSDDHKLGASFKVHVKSKELLNKSGDCLSKEFEDLWEVMKAISSARTESEKNIAQHKFGFLIRKKIMALNVSPLEMDTLANEVTQEISQEISD